MTEEVIIILVTFFLSKDYEELFFLSLGWGGGRGGDSYEMIIGILP